MRHSIDSFKEENNERHSENILVENICRFDEFPRKVSSTLRLQNVFGAVEIFVDDLFVN